MELLTVQESEYSMAWMHGFFALPVSQPHASYNYTMYVKACMFTIKMSVLL